jgi:hypothetical protein
MSLQVFNEYLNTSRTEVVAQAVDKFNAASNGTLTLSAGANQGDYNVEAFYTAIGDLVRRRNQYGAGSVTAADIAQLNESSVKIGAGTPPINHPPSWWTWMQKSPEEAGVILGRQLGVAQTQDLLNTAISGAAAAIQGVGATVVYDGSAATASLSNLSKATALFGDRSQALSGWIMHSKVFHDLEQAGLVNTARLFTFENVTIMQDASGRPFVVTDSPSLLLATPDPDQYLTMGLVRGAVSVEMNGDFTDNVQVINGDENLLRTYQAEWSYNLAIKGFEWDQAAGGKSPNNAAIGTATNWDKTATDIKDTAGVILKSL